MKAGNVSMTVEIERIRNPGDSSLSVVLNILNETDDLVIITLNVLGHVSIDGGQLYGDPDSCWEPWAEVEIDSVTNAVTGNDWLDMLTEDELKWLENDLLERFHEGWCSDDE